MKEAPSFPVFQLSIISCSGTVYTVLKSSYPLKYKKEPLANIYYLTSPISHFPIIIVHLVFLNDFSNYSGNIIHFTKYCFLLISNFFILILENLKLIFPSIYSCEKHMIFSSHAGHRSLDIYSGTFFIPYNDKRWLSSGILSNFQEFIMPHLFSSCDP